jgi:uncharacterized protein
MSTPPPWYKQFWPWFIIILPLCAVTASFSTLYIAINNSDSLVKDDYYKDGKAINMDLRKIKQAKHLGIKFLITKEGNSLVLSQEGGPAYQAALSFELFHPTIEAKDFKLLATADANYHYRIQLPDDIKGNWEVKLESFDNQWRIQQRVNFSDQTEYWLQ